MNASPLSLINPAPKLSLTMNESAISAPATAEKTELTESARELELWLLALQSFLSFYSQPSAGGNKAQSLDHDWSAELRVVRWNLLHCANLAMQLAATHRADFSTPAGEQFLTAGEGANGAPAFSLQQSLSPVWLNNLAALAGDSATLCEALLQNPAIDLPTWLAFSKILGREFNAHPTLRAFSQLPDPVSLPELPAALKRIVALPSVPEIAAADLTFVFRRILHILERLQTVKTFLRRDQPLKPILSVFTLIHAETNFLLDRINNRTLRFLSPQEPLYNVLDSTAYGLSMELRKVFMHELVGVSSKRTATAIYAVIETSQGLLFDSLQHSVVAIAQVFDENFEGAVIFPNFQTKLEQSLILRRDLWEILQKLRKAETDPANFPVALIIERLNLFRQKSMRFLMYKDCDTAERFIEEIFRFRDTSEITSVLHRFGAYIETLLGQVNMRTALMPHPFEYPQFAD